MLATLDERLTKLTRQAIEEKTSKDAYEKAYDITLQSVQEKQKEIKIIQRPVNTLKSGPTAAGLALMEKRKEQERLAEEREREAKEKKNDDMDVDDENGKGKAKR